MNGVTRPSSASRLLAGSSLTGLGLAALIAVGCGTVRIHDPGRLQLSSEAVELAAQVSTGTGGVFTPMEQNLEAVQGTQTKLSKLIDAHALETFKVTLPNLTSARIADRLLKEAEHRKGVLAEQQRQQQDAGREINEALDRQTVIVELLKDNTGGNDTLATLTRIRKRLDWLDDIGRALNGLRNATLSPAPQSDAKGGVADAVAKASGQVSSGTDGFNKALTAARSSLESVEKSPTVTAATQLIRSVAEQTITIEQTRLLAMREHLAAVQGLSETVEVRDRITVCNVLVPAFGQVYTAVDSQKQQKINDLVSELVKSGRYSTCLTKDVLEKVVDVKDLWAKGRLADYVAADIKKNGDRAKSPELVGALGVTLFHERRLLDDLRLDLARERHLYSIRLSRINAQQRAGLVHQLSSGLEVYYRGGIKPETVAQLILAAAQVGAITFVGAQQ